MLSFVREYKDLQVCIFSFLKTIELGSASNWFNLSLLNIHYLYFRSTSMILDRWAMVWYPLRYRDYFAQFDCFSISIVHLLYIPFSYFTSSRRSPLYRSGQLLTVK